MKVIGSYKFKVYISLCYTLAIFVVMLTGCGKGESYSTLLRDEEKAVNWYLAQHKVEVSVPEDSIFEIGQDAPFYRMDRDGTVYMQVIREGSKENRPENGEKIYFRFSRRNIKLMYEGTDAPSEGNADNLASAVGPTFFFYGNEIYPTTTQFGTGIQLPMRFMGLPSEVNLVLKSYSGFTVDKSDCIPYIVNVKYYKAEY